MKVFIFLILLIVFQNTSLIASSNSEITENSVLLEDAEFSQQQIVTQSAIEKKAWKMAYKIQKKLKKKAKRKGIKSDVEFEDVATLAGAIVCILGVISIIFSPIGGLIVAGLGLLIYLIGKSQGGEINNIIQAIDD
jgi:Flp pilus assembly protein TadB